jgi:hypothetical protein
MAFLAKFFPTGKTNALHGRISNFQQTTSESFLEEWERLQEYILACLDHGMEDWLILQNFYNGLTHIQSPHRCYCWRSLLLTHSQGSYDSN